MIFVTVGTHEQPFNRLIKKVDELVRDGVITEGVFMQIGFSTYEPKYTKWAKVIGYEEMKGYENEAQLVITHGGPATFMSVLSEGKRAIVVPRLEKYGEHVNNHQLDFCRLVKSRGYDIEVVEDIEVLEGAIFKESGSSSNVSSNTKTFISQLEIIINSLF